MTTKDGSSPLPISLDDVLGRPLGGVRSTARIARQIRDLALDRAADRLDAAAYRGCLVITGWEPGWLIAIRSGRGPPFVAPARSRA